MQNKKNIEIYYVFDSEINKNLSKINYLDSVSNITISYTSIANLYNSCDTSYDNGKIIGSSTNLYDIFNKNVYVIREDNLYIKNLGILTFNFSYSQTYNNIDVLPTSKELIRFENKPIYKDGVFKNKDVEIILQIFENFRTYTIVYN